MSALLQSGILTASGITEDTGKPSEWLEKLSHHGILRWQHGHTNLGLLLPVLLEIGGWQGDILSLCDALPCSAHAVNVPDILAVMSALGYRVQHERIQSGQIKSENLPGLFVPANAHSWRAGIVLRELGEYGLIWDDGREQYRGNLPDVQGDYYVFERIQVNDAEQSDGLVQSWLSTLFERFRPLVWHAVGLSLAMHLFTLAMPIFSMVVYDRVINAHSPGTLPLLAIGVTTALIVEHMIRWMRIRIAGWIGARSGLLSTGAMFERLLFLPASIIEQASISAQIARIRAFESVRDFITGPVFLTILEIPFLFVLIAVIAFIAGPVALVATAIVVLQILMALFLHAFWKRNGREAAHAAARRQHLLMDMIGNIRPLYAAGLSERILARFQSVSLQSAIANHRFMLNSAILQHASAFITVTAGVVTIVWSLERIWEGAMTGGAMVATMIITWRVLYPLQALCSVMPQLEQIRASLTQVSQLMNYKPEAHAAHVVLARHPLQGRIDIHNIGMRYDRKSDPIFMGLNIKINKGEIIAIYGGNGSGKSSILRLLLGLYPPVVGSVRFDGVDHRQFDPRSLRRQIAYLPQQPELFPGTIADNLHIVEPLAEEYRLRQALLWADAWDTIQQLPAGINTPLGEYGFTPSSGLSARIMLARLYLSDRPLVLCDELSAQLVNSSTGDHFRRYIEECRTHKTVVFVTHRQDWLALADNVIWLKPDERPIITKPEPLLGQLAHNNR